MRFAPRTLAGQLIGLVMIALVIAQVASLVLFFGERSQAIRSARHLGLLERTASIVQVIEKTPKESREAIIAAIRSPRLRVWISEQSPLTTDPRDRRAGRLAAEFEAALPYRLREPARIGLTGESDDIRRLIRERRGDDDEHDDDDSDEHGEDDEHREGERRHSLRALDIAVSVPLSSGGWLNVATGFRPPGIAWAYPTLVSLPLMAIAILVAVVFGVRRITRPLGKLAIAAQRLGRGEDIQPLDEIGPDEVRRATAAFNAMQGRLTRFMRDRTFMLAAIGHDLRTPITAMRLRVEMIDDEDVKARLLASLDEMQQMAEAALAFAREDAAREETRRVDLGALVESVADDLAEIGGEIAIGAPDKIVFSCRPNALKRALRNLIENGLRYGKRVRVALARTAEEVAIVIDDDGPGIAESQLERVFEPFVRLDESRSRETGGVGLGLAIARSIVRGHGGDIALINRPEGGLRATIHLPIEESATKDKR